MNYEKIYNDLVQKAQTQILPKNTYIERHHIMMKCLGGSNDKSNIVRLTPQQHYIAHLLLYKIYKNQMLKGMDKTPYYKSLGALSAMTQFPASKDENDLPKRCFKFGHRMYGIWKTDLAKNMSELNSGENSPLYNRKAYYSAELDKVKYFLSTDIIPNGFKLGNPKAYSSGTSNTHWYYNCQTFEEACFNEEEYSKLDQSIWKSGQSPNRKQFVRYNPSIGTKCMYNEQLRKTTRVNPEDFDKFLSEGWNFGAIYNWCKFDKNKSLVQKVCLPKISDEQKLLAKQLKQQTKDQIRFQRKAEKEKTFNAKREKDIRMYTEMYKVYSQFGWNYTKQKFNYPYSYPNFCQRCQVLLPEFIPQNGKKRGF